jgi:UDP-N-acetylmuramate dehydrogenase
LGELNNNNITNPTLKDVSNAVIAIRQSKLPDPKVLGNMEVSSKTQFF